MAAVLLDTKRVEKPWGRHHLWPGFADPAADADPIGEVWFEAPGGEHPPLLIKYIFTSEKLSVQVHPNDEQARAAGYPSGKDEAWVVLAAEPDSTIALGTHETLSPERLRTAALDGSIEGLLDWKPVKAGDVIYSAAGTIHAIGAGITLIEVQQNLDLTYRLYDYGRPRELHLDQGIAVANARPFNDPLTPEEVAPGRTILFDGRKFVLERWTGGTWPLSLPAGMSGWLIPLAGQGSANGVAWRAGECLMVSDAIAVDASADADLLFAYPGADRI